MHSCAQRTSLKITLNKWALPVAFVLLATIVTFSGSLRAREPALPVASPESVGMSAGQLARFDTLAAEYIGNGRIAGVVALVLRDGKIVHETVQGVQDVSTGAPLRSDSIFRIASQTKLVMSVATMILVEEGQLLLDDPVARYIPEYAKTTVAVENGDEVNIVAANRQITIEDLLTHTSGIPGAKPGLVENLYAEASISQGDGQLNHLDESIDAFTRRLAGLPFAAQPGEAWVYGMSTDVLGAVIERVSGMTLEEFLRNRIFAPLGMPDTHFYLPLEKLERLAANHKLRDEGGPLVASAEDPSWDGQGAYVEGPRRLFSGNGGLLSTAGDYARFLQMLLNEGELDGARILSPASVRLMTVNHIGDLYARWFPGMGFGFNVEVKLDPAVMGYEVPASASPGAYAWGGAAYTRFWVDPAQGIIGVFMTQTRPTSGDLHQKFGNIVYGAIITPASS
jgi:CubicO group peptidase (beta-lactamase class C family)